MEKECFAVVVVVVAFSCDSISICLGTLRGWTYLMEQQNQFAIRETFIVKRTERTNKCILLQLVAIRIKHTDTQEMMMIIFTSLNPQHPIGAESDSGVCHYTSKKTSAFESEGDELGVNEVAI